MLGLIDGETEVLGRADTDADTELLGLTVGKVDREVLGLTVGKVDREILGLGKIVSVTLVDGITASEIFGEVDILSDSFGDSEADTGDFVADVLGEGLFEEEGDMDTDGVPLGDADGVGDREGVEEEDELVDGDGDRKRNIAPLFSSGIFIVEPIA